MCENIVVLIQIIALNKYIDGQQQLMSNITELNIVYFILIKDDPLLLDNYYLYVLYTYSKTYVLFASVDSF